MDPRPIEEAFEAATREIGKAVVGQRETVEGLLVALLAQGNVLIEGAPGLGKTLLVNSLARSLDCRFRRVQFTPDLMPGDITGHGVFDLQTRQFNFVPGPLFTNLLLADEINRAPAKTQSALLEAMQERQVTADGRTYPLGRPFLVVATQNPIEQEGTYPLPEAQLDRFMFKLIADYPSEQEERDILNLHLTGPGAAQEAADPTTRDAVGAAGEGVRAVLTADRVVQLQQTVREVIVEARVVDYIAAVVRKTRSWQAIEVGASPRAGVNLLAAVRALAAARGRDFVIPDDVKELAPAVLRHRLRLHPDAEIEGVTPDTVVREILDAVPAPRR